MSVILKQEKPVARKEHRCCFCGAYINKGEKYSHDVYISDGEIDDQKKHLDCEEALIEFFDPYDEYWSVDYIMEPLNEELRENGIEPAKSVYEAVKQWIELRNTKNDEN